MSDVRKFKSPIDRQSATFGCSTFLRSSRPRSTGNCERSTLIRWTPCVSRSGFAVAINWTSVPMLVTNFKLKYVVYKIVCAFYQLGDENGEIAGLRRCMGLML